MAFDILMSRHMSSIGPTLGLHYSFVLHTCRPLHIIYMCTLHNYIHVQADKYTDTLITCDRVKKRHIHDLHVNIVGVIDTYVLCCMKDYHVTRRNLSYHANILFAIPGDQTNLVNFFWLHCLMLCNADVMLHTCICY